MATKVTGDQYERITRKLFEIGRQIHQPSGYPFDPDGLDTFLRRTVEGKFKESICNPIWKTIKLGTHKSVADLRKALEKDGFKTSNWASDILSKPAFTISPKKTEINLVVISVAELGFPDGATRTDIYGHAIELGLELCPPEVGPQLRLQYKDQPKGEWLCIAIDPITDSDGDLNIFNVGHDDDDLWLISDYGDPATFWDADYRWVFVLRK